MFYPSGIVSDRFGRKAVAVPCIMILSIGHFLLPLSHAFSSLMLVALLLGFGNGMGSGIVMTLGADRAPEVGRASFLAVWRLVSDAGTTAGPLIGAAVIALGSLALAPPVIGVLGIASAGVVAKWLREPDDLKNLIIEGEAGT
jgi:MFS family permease